MMSQRTEFVILAAQEGVNFRQLCRRFKISAKTGYKWRSRHLGGGTGALEDRSRRPRHSPGQTKEQLVSAVIEERRAHPTWGGRKLRRRLQDRHFTDVPSASTCTAILRRERLLDPAKSEQHRPFHRFARGAPNDLWQMDFKGHFGLQNGGRCHPLTTVDDHSRFNLILQPLGNERGPSVQQALTAAFSTYGLPNAILCDNGPPWGAPDQVCAYTTLTVWLLRLGVQVWHGHPYHPQTQGKVERFNRTLLDDLIAQHTWRDLDHCAELFPQFRDCYNCERPHQSLKDAVPASCYQPSPRSLPASLPPLDYDSPLRACVVRPNGTIVRFNQTWYIGRAFAGLTIGLRPSAQTDGQWLVYFGQLPIGSFDLRFSLLPKKQLRSIYDIRVTELFSNP